MRASFYTRDQLAAMPLKILRNIDIKEKDEELLVQEIVNAKLAKMPPENVALNRASDITDFKSSEEEQAFQKVIDERAKKNVPQVEPKTESTLVAKIAKVKKTK